MLEKIILASLERYLFFYLMGGFCLLGILIKFCLSRTYIRYIRAADEMGTTNNTWMKQMKQRFETLYKLKIGVQNVEVFVEKHGTRKRFCGILLLTWECFSGQTLGLCLAAGVAGGVLGILFQRMTNEIILSFFAGTFGAAFLMFIDRMVAIPVKRAMMLTSMKDYFENYFQIRMEREYPIEQNLESSPEADYIDNEVAAASEIGQAGLSLDRRLEKKRLKIEKKEEKRQLKLQKKEKKLLQFIDKKNDKHRLKTSKWEEKELKSDAKENRKLQKKLEKQQKIDEKLLRKVEAQSGKQKFGETGYQKKAAAQLEKQKQKDTMLQSASRIHPSKLSRKEKTNLRQKEKQELIQLLKESRQRDKRLNKVTENSSLQEIAVTEEHKTVDIKLEATVDKNIKDAVQTDDKQQGSSFQNNKQKNNDLEETIGEADKKISYQTSSERKAAFIAAWEAAQTLEATQEKPAAEPIKKVAEPVAQTKRAVRKEKAVEDKLVEEVLREFLA